MRATELNVQGMSCGSCVKHVNDALQTVAGVGEIEVDLQSGYVRVNGSPDPLALLTALQNAGYPAQLAIAATPVESKFDGCGNGRGCCCK
ncbi:heavy-metal-associated domain-containing protein [Pseudomonas sp. DP16D-R1]|uniref:heavy-metal-associated domain-containing protein n=1 Tax=Pseudomonas sp. DP16D-R1 TaxID=2075551 RepID=UPI000CD22074|nr:heavy metal-associated domain-containing protein [Pseudomonas sp. DP16D-R1]POA72323.1 copper-binding protein [Pseudomonas sp. DP16D-R1]